IDDPEAPSISAPAASRGAPPLTGWFTEAHDLTGPNSYKQKVLDDNPSLYWRLGDPTSTATDTATGGAHPGTYVNSPAQNVHGAVPEGDNTGGAVDLDGSSQFISSFYGNRRNLIINPSFETNTGWWAPWGSPTTWTRTTSQAQSGSASHKV